MKRKYVGILAGVVIAVGFGANFVFSNMQAFEKKPETAYAAGDEESTGAIRESESTIDDSQKAPRDIVKGLAEGYDGHSFVNQYHYFYNESICYGKLNEADYQDQKIAAEQILLIIEDRQISDKDLAADFDQIERYASYVIDGDDRGSMKKLHRLFHDLDFYMNGKQAEYTWGITDYRGE
ncbi:hypothetical protein ABES23_06085 [Peribacillus frigoritolerans]|uniref:hypothetical protein n=1 Tax=Peribacillus frigoritolerans TaxID=450367 RepID=UPI003D2BE1C4